MTKTCLYCKSEFKCKPSHFNRRTYCSFACRNSGYIGRAAWNKGRKCEWAKKLPHLFSKNKRPWNYGLCSESDDRVKNLSVKQGLSRRGSKATVETRLKMSLAHKGKKLTKEHCEKISKVKSGSGSSFWRGGKTKERQKIYNSRVYQLWRKNVFHRDNFTCKDCKERGGYLEAHHIKPFSLYPELRFDIDNGITLCKKCHMNTDTYGTRVNRYKRND